MKKFKEKLYNSNNELKCKETIQTVLRTSHERTRKTKVIRPDRHWKTKESGGKGDQEKMSEHTV